MSCYWSEPVPQTPEYLRLRILLSPTIARLHNQLITSPSLQTRRNYASGCACNVYTWSYHFRIHSSTPAADESTKLLENSCFPYSLSSSILLSFSVIFDSSLIFGQHWFFSHFGTTLILLSFWDNIDSSLIFGQHWFFSHFRTTLILLSFSFVIIDSSLIICHHWFIPHSLCFILHCIPYKHPPRYTLSTN